MNHKIGTLHTILHQLLDHFHREVMKKVHPNRVGSNIMSEPISVLDPQKSFCHPPPPNTKSFSVTPCSPTCSLIVAIASGSVCLEKQVGVSTGGKVEFTLPHIFAQPPCVEIGVNCLDTIVCPPTCDTVGNTTGNPPQHHGREGEDGTPILGDGERDLEP